MGTNNGDKTEGQFDVHGVNCVQPVHLLSQGFDGEEVPGGHCVIQCDAMLAVDLVVQVESRTLALQQSGKGEAEWGTIWPLWKNQKSIHQITKITRCMLVSLTMEWYIHLDEEGRKRQ